MPYGWGTLGDLGSAFMSQQVRRRRPGPMMPGQMMPQPQMPGPMQGQFGPVPGGNTGFPGPMQGQIQGPGGFQRDLGMGQQMGQGMEPDPFAGGIQRFRRGMMRR